MFGLRNFFGRSGESNNDVTASSSNVQSSEPIFVSDYIGTAESSEPGTVPGSDPVVFSNPVSAVNDFGFYAARPDRSVITLSTLTNFSTKKTESERLLNHKIAGCDGEFPVTNPVKNNIYFNKADNKYYICKKGSTGTVAAPDTTNFEYISLKNASGGNAVKGIKLTGSATGTGTYSEDTGIYTIATDVQYANVKGTPSSLKNPNKLTISLNGTATEYDGSAVKTVSITPTSIGAQPAGNYAVNGHTHTVANITDMPKSMPNPYGLTLKLNGVAQTAYTGSKAVDINITPAGIGAQPAGSYAPTVHNHDTQYNTKTEITQLLAGKLGKTENAVSASKLATARTISLTGAVTGSVGFDGSGNAAISTTLAGFDASKIVSGVISADRIPKTAFSEFVPVKDKAARLALTKQEVQNGDTVKEIDSKKMYLVIDDTKLSSEEGYQDYTTVVDWNTIIGRPSSFNPTAHTHTWSQISDRPSTMANPNALTISLNGTAQTAYTGASAVAFNITPASIGAQVAGSYASASHNHSGVYAPVSHTHNGNQITALTGYVKAESASAIAVTDSLIVALGKLEKALDGKQNTGSYAPSSHNHSSANITSLSGYTKATAVSAIATGDTLNAALGKLEKALDSKQAAGSYALANHNHDSVYQPKGSYAASNHNHDSAYAKVSHTHLWEHITDKPSTFTPSSHTHTWANITDRPSTMANPHALTISLNGKAQTAYSGSAAVAFDITPASIGAQVAGSYASSSHNHNGVYAPATHSHTIGQIGVLTGYAKAASVSAITTSDTILTAIGKLEKALDSKQASGNYSVVGHKHDDLYQPKGSYASSGHNHDDVYSKLGHAHAWGEITGKPSSFTPSAHNQAANTITAMTGYAKPSSTGAIATTDTLNAAIGKLEKALDGKQAAGSYAAANHNHDSAYAAKSHNHDGVYQPAGNYAAASHTHTIGQIGALAGYAKAASVSAITTSDTILTAIGKLEKALDGKQASGSYASASHNHDSVYSKLGHAHAWGEITGKPSTFAPSGHNQASNTINVMTGYSKPSSTSAISASDSLNTAIGKLEKALDTKQAAGSYASASHNHSGVYAPVSHDHTIANISIGEHYTAGYVHGLMAPFVPSARGNKLFGVSPKDVVIEYSKDGGKTWLDYGASESQKAGLFNELGTGSIAIGKATTKELNAAQGTNSRLRITISAKSIPRYVSINKTYMWFSSSGNTCKCSCKVLKGNNNTDNWTTIWNDKTVSGWSGGNFYNHSQYAFQGSTASSETNCLKVRYEFWMTELNTNYSAGSIYFIAGYGDNAWGDGGLPFVGNDHLYKWDSAYNMILPSGLEAKGEIKGTATKAKQDEQGNVIHTTYSKTSHSHSWGEISGRPSTLPNPNGLTISLNGKAQTTYTGASAVSFNITPASIGAQAAGSYAAASHSHSWDSITSKPGSFTPSAHNQASSTITAMTGYSKASSVAAISASDSLNTAIGKLEKALDGKQASGSYAASNHNHDSAYAAKSHSHSWDSVTGKPSSFTPSSHNQASSTINSMSGYSKPSSTGAITASDTLNAAIGKLEKALDGKQAAGSYAASNHNHSGVYQPAGNYAAASHTHDDRYFTETEINSKLAGYQPKGSYAAASHGNHVPTTQTANNKIFLRCDNTWHTITPAEIGAQPAGSYAASNHNHNGVYVTTGDRWRFDPKSIGNSSTNTDLNNIVEQGYYVSTSSSNKFTNTPDNLTAFELFVTGIGYNDAASYKTQLIKDISRNRYYVRTQTNWTTPVSWTAWSQIAVTSDLNSKLSTSGGTISGALTVTGQILSNADVVAYSDKRVKTNVVKIDDALNKVDQISGYTYDMQGLDFKGKRQAGVIAQELLEVLPEAVVQDDNGMYAVRYTNIIPLLIEAVKEEKSNVDELKSKIESLEEKNRNLEERLAKIEKMLENK